MRPSASKPEPGAIARASRSTVVTVSTLAAAGWPRAPRGWAIKRAASMIVVDKLPPDQAAPHPVAA